MRLNLDRQYQVQGWTVSALVHGLALTTVFGLMSQVHQPVSKETFTWDVALVEPETSQEPRQAEINPAQEPAEQTPRPKSPAPVQPHVITQDLQTREVTPAAQHEISQVVETSQPIQQKAVVHTRTEAVTPVNEQRPAEAQQVKQSMVESAFPVVQHDTVTSETGITAAPVQQVVPQPVTTQPVAHPVEPRAVETMPAARVLSEPASSLPEAAAVIDAKPVEPVVRESAPLVAVATSPTPAVKADHRWLAESLWQRVAELKRYPSGARLNGWEGKVVLRVVIRADGHLADVRIQKSSGYDELDRAALEAVRLASPLHMKHELNTPEVAMNLPIVYSLTN